MTPLPTGQPRKRDKAKAILHSILFTPSGLFGSKGSEPPQPTPRPQAFRKSKSFTKDIAVLSMTYPLAENPDLKELVRLIVAINADGKIVHIVEACAHFTVQLAFLAESHPSEAAPAITAFLITVREIDLSHITKTTGNQDATILKDKVDNAIVTIKASNPLLTGPTARSSQAFFDVLDTVTGVIIPPLEILNDASDLIPVPLVQSLLGSVIGLLKAAQQTRANFGDMKQIATTAGEFVVSLAVICSDNKIKLSSQFERAYNTFLGKLHDIAQQCADLSELPLYSRFFQQAIHTDEVSAIRCSLQSAIEEFQTVIATLGYRNLESIAQNLDALLLNNLPSLPSFVGELNEYLEGSRDHDIEYVCNWMDDSNEPILWLHGAAGLGKSMLAHQLIEHLRSKGRLATFAFFVTGSADNPATLIRMMSRELGEFHHESIPKIVDATRNCDGTHVPLREYLAAYILDPIQSLRHPRQLAIVIDAMNEWRYSETFLEELKHIPSPSPVKFIVTSRVTRTIERGLGGVIARKYPLEPVSQDIVVKYFERSFKVIEWRGQPPDPSKVSQLATLADGLLSWAATVCSMLSNEFDPRTPIEIVDDIISSGRNVAGGEKRTTLSANSCARADT